MIENFFKIDTKQVSVGYSNHEIICDDQGNPKDYRFINMNDFYGRLLNRKKEELLGKTAVSLFPEITNEWLNICGNVALNGEPVHFQNYLGRLKKYFDITIYSPQPTQFVIIAVDITDQKNLENALKESETRMHAVANSANDAILIMDSRGLITFWNPAAKNIFGYSAAEAIGQNLHNLIAPAKYHKTYNSAFSIFKKSGKGPAVGKTLDFESCRKDKTKIYVQLSLSAIRINNEWHSVGMIRDITVQKHSADLLKQSEMRLIAAQKMAHVGNWELDLSTNKMWASEEACNIFGIDYNAAYLPQDLIRKSALPEYHSKLDAAWTNLIFNHAAYDIEFQIKNQKNGEIRYVHSIGNLIRDEYGNPSKVLGTVQDVTNIKLKEEKILDLSFHDQLTGLYNRRFYKEELKRMDLKKNLPLTILMGDINGLKLINDSFGHDVGDTLLKKAATILKKCCRANDIISRIGGDEFVILLPQTDRFETEQLIKRIKIRASKEEVASIDISISFGYETMVNETESVKDVFKKAEDHMYHNKLFESPSLRSKTIDTIMKTLYEKNMREEQHSHRVSTLCQSMGEVLGFPEHKIKELKTVGLLHDIGKIAIDEKILNKPDKLTTDEWLEIRRHSEIGYRILSTVNEMSEIAEYVLAHHEKWDGSGYPKGLKSNEIPLESRIITISDAYDAMTSERTYQPKMKVKDAVTELQKNAGIQFDPSLVMLFIEKVIKTELSVTLG